MYLFPARNWTTQTLRRAGKFSFPSAYVPFLQLPQPIADCRPELVDGCFSFLGISCPPSNVTLERHPRIPSLESHDEYPSSNCNTTNQTFQQQ